MCSHREQRSGYSLPPEETTLDELDAFELHDGLAPRPSPPYVVIEVFGATQL
jgi:hypothetical protein